MDNGIFIFDTNIFLTGVDFNLFKGTIYTTPSIIKEIDVRKYKNKNRNILNRIQVAIEIKKLIIKSPSANFIQKVEKVSNKTGDVNALSEPDKQLIALTLELREISNQGVIIYTNDYTMENLCSELNIKFSSLYKNGIKKGIIFEIYCPYCNSIHNAEDLNMCCERCGSKLKRRPKNKKKV